MSVLGPCVRQANTKQSNRLPQNFPPNYLTGAGLAYRPFPVTYQERARRSSTSGYANVCTAGQNVSSNLWTKARAGRRLRVRIDVPGDVITRFVGDDISVLPVKAIRGLCTVIRRRHTWKFLAVPHRKWPMGWLYPSCLVRLECGGNQSFMNINGDKSTNETLALQTFAFFVQKPAKSDYHSIIHYVIISRAVVSNFWTRMLQFKTICYNLTLICAENWFST